MCLHSMEQLLKLELIGGVAGGNWRVLAIFANQAPQGFSQKNIGAPCRPAR